MNFPTINPESNEQLPSRKELIATLAKAATSPNILAANTIDPDQHTGKQRWPGLVRA